eukprot:5247337-Pyramimonas_sp.AAC.1
MFGSKGITWSRAEHRRLRDGALNLEQAEGLRWPSSGPSEQGRGARFEVPGSRVCRRKQCLAFSASAGRSWARTVKDDAG